MLTATSLSSTIRVYDTDRDDAHLERISHLLE
jgi:hypothetical protein